MSANSEITEELKATFHAEFPTEYQCRLVQFGLRMGFRLPEAVVKGDLVYRYGEDDTDPVAIRDVVAEMLGWFWWND